MFLFSLKSALLTRLGLKSPPFSTEDLTYHFLRSLVSLVRQPTVGATALAFHSSVRKKWLSTQSAVLTMYSYMVKVVSSV